jgi:hypothetical protein
MKTHFGRKVPLIVALLAGTGCSSDGTGAGPEGSGGSAGTTGPSSGGGSQAAGGSDGNVPAAGGHSASAGGSGATPSGGGGRAASGGAGGAIGASGGAVASGGAAGAGGKASGGSAGTSAGGSAGVSGAAGAGGAVMNAILVPAQGALLGEYYGDGTVAQTDMRIGRKPAVHLTYVAWSDDWARVAQRDLTDGKIPLINWEPAGIDFNDIVGGKLDSTIQARATGAKNLGKPFFLDFAAEMNGDEGWSGNDAPLYVSAYRHIHDLFVAGGATNVVWAWCPNVTDVNGGNKNTLDYYPGDSYVDWTGVDGYNWGSGGGFAWQSFHDVFARIYPILAGKGKPILIGEMASDENGGDKAAWIDAILPTLKNDFPLIRGLVWFDVHKERNWQINSSSGSLAAYQRFAKDPYMN